MNRLEYLLTVLNEECAELQQATSKALRFGLQDGYPGTARTNESDMRIELNQVYAVVDMLKEEGLNLDLDSNVVRNKKINVERYLEYSKSRGRLN